MTRHELLSPMGSTAHSATLKRNTVLTTQHLPSNAGHTQTRPFCRKCETASLWLAWCGKQRFAHESVLVGQWWFHGHGRAEWERDQPKLVATCLLTSDDCWHKDCHQQCTCVKCVVDFCASDKHQSAIANLQKWPQHPWWKKCSHSHCIQMLVLLAPSPVKRC